MIRVNFPDTFYQQQTSVNPVVLILVLVAIWYFFSDHIKAGFNKLTSVFHTTTEGFKQLVGAGGALEKKQKLNMSKCSKACCNRRADYPNGIDTNEEGVDASKYVPTNLMCNWGEGSGCLCVDKEQSDYVATRGGNSKEGKLI